MVKEVADEKEPIRLRVSWAGASCWRNAPSIVCVLGRIEAGRRGGLVEVPSTALESESWNTTPCRLLGKPALALVLLPGIVLGDV